MNDYINISFYLFSLTSRVGPNYNMAPPSRAKGGAMAPVPPPPPAAASAGVGLGWRQGRLSVRQLGRRTRAAVTQQARVKCVVLVKPSDARLRNQASVTEQDVRKRFICDLPVSFPYHNRWRKQSGKRCRILSNQHFQKGRR